MLGAITKGIAKVFGTKADKDLKMLVPYVDKVDKEYQKLRPISDDQLRGKTKELKDEINSRLKSIDDQIDDLHKKSRRKP